MSLFVSLFAYPLGKEAGERGVAEQRLVMLEVESGTNAKWPGFRTLYRARTLEPLELHVDCGTLIARARSAAAARFLEIADADVWLSIDDDVEASAATLSLLIQAVRDGHDLVSVPALCANAQQTNVRFTPHPPTFDIEALPVVRQGALQSRIAPVEFSGFALYAASRRAIEALKDGYPDLVCDKAGDRPALGVFLEEIIDGRWYGEDAAFHRRARCVGLVPETLLDCETRHAGRGLPTNWFDLVRKEAP